MTKAKPTSVARTSTTTAKEAPATVFKKKTTRILAKTPAVVTNSAEKESFLEKIAKDANPPEGIRIVDQKVYDILHDALNDFIAAPINRANHVQALLNGINLKSNSYELMAEDFTSTMVNNIVEQLQNAYPDSDVIVTTMSHDNRLETFFINVEQVVEEPGNVDENGGAPKKVHYFQNFVCGSRYIKFVNAVMPFNSDFGKLLSFFTGLMRPKAFTVLHFDIGGAATLPVDSRDCVVYNEFYPFIPEGPDALIDNYFASRSATLILTGIAGSGKSSLIRRLFSRREDYTFIMVDNSAIYQDPKAFSDLAKLVSDACAESKDKPVILILEEADYAIQSKDADHAGTLGRLLSMSDGIVRRNLKIVITSNLNDVNRIDPNLRRSGRTFKVISFRALTTDEANVARGAIGKPAIDTYGVNNVTLAIALNFQEDEAHKLDVKNSQRRTVGFVS